MSDKNVKAFAVISKYFIDVKSEFKKVIWPTPKQTVNNTAIVITVVILVGILIAILDYIFSGGLNLLLNKGASGAVTGLLNK